MDVDIIQVSSCSFHDLPGTTPLMDPKEDLFKKRVIVEEGDTLDRDGDVVMR